MTQLAQVKISKTLSYALRHRPDALGLTLDAHGWTSVQAVLDGLAAQGISITVTQLDEIIAADSKSRFVRDSDRIRAQQGHTTHVDGMPVDASAPATPPAVLYHGTPEANVASILTQGLIRRERDVHLSADIDTAVVVGSRRCIALGPAVVLVIDAARAAADGLAFRVSGNGVWLTDVVPAQYLTVLADR